MQSPKAPVPDVVHRETYRVLFGLARAPVGTLINEEMNMLNYSKAFLLYPAAERYLGRDIRSKLKELRRESQASPAERARIQQNRLFEILQISKNHVPYYRDLFREIKFQPHDILKSTDYLQELPLLNKDILREQGIRMVNETMLGKHVRLHERRTNGSTGLATTVWYDQESLDWTAAANLFASEFSGRGQHHTEVMLSSEFFENLPHKTYWTEKIKSWSLNRVNIRTNTFDDEGLDKIIKELRAAQAYAVQGHPSTLYFLAVHANRVGANVRGLFQAFESTGDSVDASKTKLIEEVFGCRVYNRYGNAEFGVVAHSNDKIDELEVIDSVVYPESHSLGNGLDEIVLTGLLNKAMPLLRYKIGDVGEVVRRNGIMHIHQLTGRVHDLVELGGRSWPTHYIKDILEKMGGLDEFQIVQTGSEQIKTLKVVPNQACDKSAMKKRINEMFGSELNVEFTNFEGLVLQGWRDKFRYYVHVG